MEEIDKQQQKQIERVQRKYGYKPGNPAWTKGTSGNPRGRPKGSGKTNGVKKCQGFIQDLLRLKVNQDTIKAMLQDMLDNDPFSFWTLFIEPKRGSKLEMTLDNNPQHPISVNILPPPNKDK